MNLLKTLLARLKRLANPPKQVPLPPIKRAPFISRPSGSMRSINEKKAKALRRVARKIIGTNPKAREYFTNQRPYAKLGSDRRPFIAGFKDQDILVGGLRFIERRLKRMVRHGESVEEVSL